mmetsp:Transcript_73066/g.202657  ORF Transcript_73066/g.202657 Transcript_73066/m.202657 type:complete len:276 (+) Transcript_73066:1046-1873(+)
MEPPLSSQRRTSRRSCRRSMEPSRLAGLRPLALHESGDASHRRGSAETARLAGGCSWPSHALAPPRPCRSADTPRRDGSLERDALPADDLSPACHWASGDASRLESHAFEGGHSFAAAGFLHGSSNMCPFSMTSAGSSTNSKPRRGLHAGSSGDMQPAATAPATAASLPTLSLLPPLWAGIEQEAETAQSETSRSEGGDESGATEVAAMTGDVAQAEDTGVTSEEESEEAEDSSICVAPKSARDTGVISEEESEEEEDSSTEGEDAPGRRSSVSS